MVNVLVMQGKKVELYDKVGNLFKAYYIGGFIVDECGIYIIMEGVEQFYVVEIFGIFGNISVWFDCYGDEWCDKMFFLEKVEDIKYFFVEYFKQKNQLFILEVQGGDYMVKFYYDIMFEIQCFFKEGSVEVFLVNFESVGVEVFCN